MAEMGSIVISGSEPIPVGTAHGSICQFKVDGTWQTFKRNYSHKASKTVETDAQMQARVQDLVDEMQVGSNPYPPTARCVLVLCACSAGKQRCCGRSAAHSCPSDTT